MKISRLTTLIRKTVTRKLFTPIAFIIFLTLLTKYYPIYHLIVPERIENAAEINKYANDKFSYVNMTVSDLYYCGQTHVSITQKTDGAYYYFLEDGMCYYVLLSTRTPGVMENGKAVSHIKAMTLNAKLVNNPAILRELINRMSKTLGWTNSGLSAISNYTLINELAVTGSIEYLVITLIILFFLLAVSHIIVIVLAIAHPTFSKTVMRLHSFGDSKELYAMAERELEDIVGSTDGMLITENFYIGHDRFNVHIVPLEEITWAYKYGTMHGKLFRTRLTYSVCVVTENKKHFVVHKKTKSSADNILSALAKVRPEIMIGYNDNNKKYI